MNLCIQRIEWMSQGIIEINSLGVYYQAYSAYHADKANECFLSHHTRS